MPNEKSLNGLSISELSYLLNRTLEENFDRVQFYGELFEAKVWSSGHLYFTIKDEDSQLRSVMWRSHYARLNFQPSVGDKVVCFGRPNIWAKSGNLQIVVDDMRPLGEGELQKKFLELKTKLEKEGLFLESRKRKLPLLPYGVGIVTSEHGAVIHDIMVRIAARMPSIKVFLAPCRVQGEGAADEIVAAISLLNRHPQVEVIIVARGGGSLEDLWAFNEEKVVRAIFASSKIIVSGVGHETDVTLSDYAADVRAPTPTAAAEMVVPERKVLYERVVSLARRLSDPEKLLGRFHQELDTLDQALATRMANRLYRARLALNGGEVRLASLKPQLLLTRLKAKLEYAKARCAKALQEKLKKQFSHFSQKKEKLIKNSPRYVIQKLQSRLQNSKGSISHAFNIQYSQLKNRVAGLEETLLATSYHRTLGRGYVIIRRDNSILSSIKDIKIGDEIQAGFHDGKMLSLVKEVIRD
jgi:exodeoxyribonuclease VII large subunit